MFKELEAQINQLEKNDKLMLKEIEKIKKIVKDPAKLSYSVSEASTAMGVKPITIRRWIQDNIIRAVKLDNSKGYLIPADELNKILKP